MIIQTIFDLQEISELVNQYFNDAEKTTQWLNTENPLLGNQEPIHMILSGRTEKLRSFIDEAGIL